MHRSHHLLSVLLLAVCGSMVGACSPEMDMQGMDPREYYTQHPIENTVKTYTVSQQVRFNAGATRLDNGEVLRLKQAFRDVSPLAADGVQVQLSRTDYAQTSRRHHLTALLRSMGYSKDKITFEPSSVLARGDVQVDVQYAAVIPPNCPDWRRSPVTTYSNTTQGNFNCATTVNLGAMVADPHDLVRGPGKAGMDTQRASRVVQQYHSGQNFGQSIAVSGGGDSGGNGGGDSGGGDSGLPDGGGQ
jgi:pilus biogenesis lipoprotein CpaD